MRLALFGISALLSLISSGNASWAEPAVWFFNVWGATDLLFALLQGLRLQIDPGAVGAAYFIPTAIVPPLLVTHALIFGLLVRSQSARNVRAHATSA